MFEKILMEIESNKKEVIMILKFSREEILEIVSNLDKIEFCLKQLKNTGIDDIKLYLSPPGSDDVFLYSPDDVNSMLGFLGSIEYHAKKAKLVILDKIKTTKSKEV